MDMGQLWERIKCAFLLGHRSRGSLTEPVAIVRWPTLVGLNAVAAAVFVMALAASSPIYSAISGSHIIQSASASPVAATGGTATKADCTTATAKRLVNEHHLNDFVLPNPVSQLLCGPFTGPGSEAMAVAIAAPTRL